MRPAELDPSDEAAFDAWYAVLHAAHEARGLDEPGWQRQELHALAVAGRRADAPVLAVTLAVREGERTVGAVRLDLPLHDNPQLASLGLCAVHPSARRRGVGRALLQEAGRRARLHGRRELVGRVEQRTGEPAPGHPFAAALGATVVQSDLRRDLRVPLDPERLEALEAACRPHASGYALRTWTDAVPEDLLQDRVALARRMSVDAPSGELETVEEAWDPARVRFGEETLRAQGRLRLAAGAVHGASGRLVAFSEVVVPAASPRRAYQWDTLVLQEHRGHRLGTSVKLANLRALPEAWPGTRTVSTWNAQDNAPVAAVNEALGAVVVGTSTTYRQVLG